MLVLFLGLAVLKSWQMTLVAAAVSPLIILAMRRFGGRIRRHARKTLERLADVTDSVAQMLSGIRVVKAFNMEAAEQEAFRDRNRQQVRRALKLVRSEAWAGVVPQFVAVSLAGALALLMADYLHRRGELELGQMAICVISLSLVASRLKRIVKAYNDLQQSTASVDRVFELIDTEPEIADSPGAVELEGVKEGVRFEDVHFAYDAEPVLKGIDLFVPCGQTYAIVGETGAGKSTMLDLIPRFYDPQQGAVKVDGLDLRDVARQSLMRQVAIVGQHPFLFNRPIAENIRYGKPDAADEEVIAAARAANIHEFITSLPEGYQTLAGEAGDRFSGGQRQCITIARALLKNAPILILDEATSSLDAQSERLVQDALENLMANRTTFVIAHRLSTVRHADQIVVLRDGRIVERGKHEELLALGGEYDRLYRLQFSDEARQEDATDAG
jgi:subfamily B ATP-binding cassette protein MsbA